MPSEAAVDEHVLVLPLQRFRASGLQDRKGLGFDRVLGAQEGVSFLVFCTGSHRHASKRQQAAPLLG